MGDGIIYTQSYNCKNYVSNVKEIIKQIHRNRIKMDNLLFIFSVKHGWVLKLF